MNGHTQNTVAATSPQTQPRALQPYYVTHEFGGSSELTTTLVHALSDVTGADVTQAEFTLSNHVDPDALDRLFEPAPDGTQRASGHVSFDLWGRQVTVHHNGQIVISPPAGAYVA